MSTNGGSSLVVIPAEEFKARWNDVWSFGKTGKAKTVKHVVQPL